MHTGARHDIDRRFLRCATATAAGLTSLVLAMLAPGLCGSSADGAAAMAASIHPSSSEQPTVDETHTKLGDILVDAQGMVLYRYSADRKNVSDCYREGGCVALWPVLVPGAGGRAVAGPGVVGSALGVITRKDGKKQVTYDGWPLYTYVVDRRPGQTAGQDVKDAHGIWYVVYARPKSNPTPTH